ncbi:hypothetical protein [Haloprofundus salilacus]|uniref:hypothetical protein n=1 Tax=Haloprofundus salilacus TaxID=2876190 RepID=UPI001CCAE79F|nr:hypothetical protein [Haloprofundus salilacus]
MPTDGDTETDETPETDGAPETDADGGDRGRHEGHDRNGRDERSERDDDNDAEPSSPNAERKEPNPPENLPTAVAETLRALSTENLREAVVYGQELLQVQRKTAPRIDPKPGEEFVRVEDRDGYTLVVKREPCGNDCEDCPHGPYVYHVTEEVTPSGERRARWALIGRVSET